MKNDNTARKTYKRAPLVSVRDNVITFPGVNRPITTSPTMEDLVTRLTFDGSVDIDELVRTCGTEASQLRDNGVLEYLDRAGNVVWSVVRGEIMEASE